MDATKHNLMTCSTRFVKQCNWWATYTVLSVMVILITFAVLEYKNFTGWDQAVKVIIVWGAATCVIWWAWILKKLYDIAHWWFELHRHVTAATQLLHETKADLKEIKSTL